MTNPEPDAATSPLAASPPLLGAARVFNNILWQGAGDVVAKLAALVFYALVARELGKHGFGEFTLVTSLVVAIEIGGMGTDLVVMREVARDRGSLGGLLWNAAAVRALGGGLIGLGVCVVGVVGDFSDAFLPALALMSLGWIVDLLLRTVFAVLRAFEDFAPITLIVVVQRVGTTAATAALLASGGGLVGVAALHLAGMTTALGLALVALRHRGLLPRIELSKTTMRRLAVSSLPLGTSHVFSAALARLDMLVLAVYTSTAAVGTYGAAYRLYEGFTFIPLAVGLAVMPWFARSTRDSQPSTRDVFSLSGKALAAVMAPIAGLMTLFPDLLVRIVFGSAYADASTAVVWLGVALAFQAPFALAAFYLTAQGRYRIFPLALGATVVVNVGLNLLAAPRYGVDGVAAVMAISQAGLTAVMLLAARRSTGGLGARRAVIGPASGLAAMAAASSLGPSEAHTAVLALVVYAAVLVLTERLLFRHDLTAALGLLRARSPGA